MKENYMNTDSLEKYAVYALVDPIDKHPITRVRYIGITDDVYARFQDHLRCKDGNLEKDEWIRYLKRSCHLPIMKTLEVVDGIEKARERERYWILHFKTVGTHLFNKLISGIDPYYRVEVYLDKNHPATRAIVVEAERRGLMIGTMVKQICEHIKDMPTFAYSTIWSARTIVGRDPTPEEWEALVRNK